MRFLKIIPFILFAIIFYSCQEPFVDNFDDNPQCEEYSSRIEKPDYPDKDTLKIMTFNIRFGIGSQILWFADACSDRTIYSNDEIFKGLDAVLKVIEVEQPDILFMQEVDINSKRSGYINELQYILDKSYFKYAIYGSRWHTQFIASDGLGRIKTGNVIFSKWPIKNPNFISLPQRGDIDGLTSIFYVRENIIYCDIETSMNNRIRAVTTHLSAFSTDDTKKKQVDIYHKLLTDFKNQGLIFVTGGDYNLLPPNSDSTDYCNEDMCSGEDFHTKNAEKFHKDGSFYTPEITWLQPLFDEFHCSLDLNKYKNNQSAYFTHCTVPDLPWDRTLDYLFSSLPWIENTHQALQKYRKESDHAPVSAKIYRSRVR